VKRFIPSLVLFGTACIHPGRPTLAITHVAIVDVAAGTTIPDRTVLIRGRKIVRIADGASGDPRGARVLDGRGRFLIPGLWDMHVHLGETDLSALLAAGITGARDMGGDLEELLAWRRRIQKDELAGPRLVFAGPLLRGPRSPNDSGPWIIRTAEQGIRAVDSLATRDVDFIKVHEGLSRDAYFAIASEARARRLPFAGHVPAGLAPGEAAAAGQHSIEHFEFIPDTCLARLGTGAVSAECDDAHFAELFATLAGHHTWLDPTIGSFRIFAPQQFPAILAGFRTLVPLLRLQHIGLLAGTDLGTTGIIPGASLHDELTLLVAAGYTPVEALRAATLNPAVFLGLADSLGTIEPGKVADLVLLEGNPVVDVGNIRRIVAVIRAGTIH
jgi:imidazolonepropionase-like amidohydrolase